MLVNKRHVLRLLDGCVADTRHTMFMLRRRGVTRYPTTKLIDIVGLRLSFDVTCGTCPQLPKVCLCRRSRSSPPTLGSTANNQLLTGTLAPAGTPQAPPTRLATDGADYLIPDLIAFLGPKQRRQRERFLENQLVIYDTPQRIAARHQLRDRISSDDFAQVSFRGLGGGGKSHNLLRFVAEQRDVGDCVMYVHNCDDLVLDGHGVVAAALVTALTSAFPTLVSTDNVLIDLIARLEQWAPIDVGVYDLEKLAISNDFFLPVRNFVRHHGKRFIVVFDQENRISRVKLPTPDSEWARKFITEMKANLVVVSASDNNEGHEQRDWPTIIQLPTPMPSDFARALLQNAAEDATSFLPSSPEWTLLEEQIETNGGLAPLEVGKVCARLRESRKPPGPNLFASVKDECQEALSKYADKIYEDHTAFYRTFLPTDKPTLVAATAKILIVSTNLKANTLPETLDRRFCAKQPVSDPLTGASKGVSIVFASPLVKRVMYDVSLQQQLKWFPHMNQVVPTFRREYFETKVFDRFFEHSRLTRVLFEKMYGSVRIATSSSEEYLSPQHAFNVMKEDALVRGHAGETKVLVLRAPGNYPNIDGLLMSACDGRIDVYFLQCTIDSIHRDIFTTFLNHDFRTWVDVMKGDTTMKGLRIRFSFLWISNIKAIEFPKGRERIGSNGGDIETRRAKVRRVRRWQLYLTADPTAKNIALRSPIFRFCMADEERPFQSRLHFSTDVSIRRSPKQRVRDRHELRECHLFVDPDTLQW